MQRFFACLIKQIIFFKYTKYIVKIEINSQKIVRKINRYKNKQSKNCAQNKALQKCAADLFVHLLVECDAELLAALGAH